MTVESSKTLDSGRLAATHATGGHSGEAPRALPGLFDGTYDLTLLMGQGSMGEVWRARNVNLDKEVAIKLVKLESGDRAADVRLRNEARLVAKMSHPNVVGVYDAGVARDGRYYLVMELLEGQDLRQVLEQRRTLPAIEAVQILVPVLAGLDCAHRRKILHRDIKPENIFVAHSEDTTVPKLVDFGIALARDLPSVVRTTGTGVFLGTPLYMAPEQVRGASDLDEGADIWAIATVLYELVTGHVPFASDDLRVLFSSITFAGVPIIDESLCDAELTAIIVRGLAKDPAARWPSAREMAGALVSWLLARGVTEDVSGDSLEKPWLSGTLRRSRLGSLLPPAEALHKVSPAALHSGATASIQPLLSRFRRSMALVSLGLLVLVLLAIIQRRPPRPVSVEVASVIAAPSPRALPVVQPASPAPVADARKLEHRAEPSSSQTSREVPTREKRERPARAQPAASALGVEPAASARGVADDVAAADDVDAPVAPAPRSPVSTGRRSTVDPTWGF